MNVLRSLAFSTLLILFREISKSLFSVQLSTDGCMLVAYNRKKWNWDEQCHGWKAPQNASRSCAHIQPHILTHYLHANGAPLNFKLKASTILHAFVFGPLKMCLSCSHLLHFGFVSALAANTKRVTLLVWLCAHIPITLFVSSISLAVL